MFEDLDIPDRIPPHIIEFKKHDELETPTPLEGAADLPYSKPRIRKPRNPVKTKPVASKPRTRKPKNSKVPQLDASRAEPPKSEAVTVATKTLSGPDGGQ